jgi:anti-anti-sigma factor
MVATLSIQRSDDAEGVVLTLAGELDVTTADLLERHLSEVMKSSPDRVLLDLHELQFVDSAGVSVLIKAKEQAEASGRRLVLRRPTAQVYNVFSVVGLVEWLEFESVC